MKYLSIIKYVLLILAAALTVYGALSYVDGDASTEGGIGIMLGFAAFMIAVTAAATILMPLVGIMQNPKSAMKSLVGVGLVALVFIVSWALSDATPITVASGDVLDNVAELRFADMALWSTYIMFSALLITMVVTETYKAFK